MPRSQPSVRSKRWPVGHSTALLLCLLGSVPLEATTIKLFPPTAAGKLKLGLKQLGDTCTPVSVDIAATDTAAEKAAKVAAAINANCGTFLSASADEDEVEVVGTVRGAAVMFKVVSDTTGEKDRIIKDPGPDGWKRIGKNPLYTARLPACGLSWDNSSPGSITVGTSAYVAVVPTMPGEPPSTILGRTAADLMAHGVTNFSLLTRADGTASLVFDLGDDDAFVEFGADDCGVDYSFGLAETLEIPALGPAGFACLACLLAVAGLLLLRGRRSRASEG